MLAFAESNGNEAEPSCSASFRFRNGGFMYLLFVDESGTHPGPHPFVLGGVAIHEDDAA